MKYIQNLSKADNHVMSVSPQAGKETRPVVGIEIFEEVIVVIINRVRTYTTHYVAEFFDRKENPKKRLTDRFSFVSRETLNAFLPLVSERTEGKIPVEDLGMKRI